MVRFLEPEWLDALDASAKGRLSCLAGVHLVVQQNVTGIARGPGRGPRIASGQDPRGDDVVRYHLVLHDGTVRVRPGEAKAPDVTLTQPYEVAVAISRGERSAQQALAGRHLRVEGDLNPLLHHARALVALDDIFATVRRQTTY